MRPAGTSWPVEREKLCSARKYYLTVDRTAVEGMSVRTRDFVAPAAFGSGFVRVLLSHGLFLRELDLSIVVSAERVAGSRDSARRFQGDSPSF